jgi:hypothetical protein
MKRWSRAKFLVSVSFGLSLSGAAQAQVFYNEKLDAQAKAAMTEYQAMRDTHLAMLKAREAGVTALSQRVDEAVVAAVRAERDLEVVRVLERPLARQGDIPSRQEELDALLTGRIQAISGLTLAQLRAPDVDFRRELIDRAGIVTTGREGHAYRPSVVFGEAAAQRVMGEDHQFFDGPRPPAQVPAERDRPKGGERVVPGDKPEGFTYATFCETVPDILGMSGAQQGEAFAALRADPRLKDLEDPVPRVRIAQRLLNQICPHFHAARRLKAKTGPGYNQLKALAGIGLSPEDIGDSTGLDAIDLGLSIGQLRSDLGLANAEVKKAQGELKRLKEAQKALKKAMEDRSASDVQAAAARIVGIVGKPPSAPAAPVALAGTAEPASGSQAQPAAASDSCSGPVTLACARQTAEAYGLASFDKARESALFEIAALLADPQARADAAKANCGPPAADVSDEQIAQATRICLTKSAMDILALRDRAADIAAGRPGELAELAVLITDAQMRVAVAEAKAAALTKRIDNLDAQRAALVNELNILLQAKTHLDQGRDYRVALLDYGRSVDKGRLAYERAGDQFTLIALNEFAAREEQVVKGRYALIDGLVATITSSTAAGLKPQELAAFLSAIGVSTLGIAEAAQ